MTKNQRKQNLNIAMIGHKRIPSREGGVEIVVEQLATRMVSKGHSVTAYNRKGTHVSGAEFSTKLNKETYKGVHIVEVFTITRKGLAAVTSSFFATIKAVFKPYDCIHYHAEGSCTMLLLAKLFRKRTVVTVHGLDWQREKWSKFAAWYIKLGEKFAVKFADEIIVLSENVVNYFKETYNRTTRWIPNGVQKPQYKPPAAIKEKWGLEKESYILYLSRLVPEKGLPYLIEAYKRLDTQKKLIIAGGASEATGFVEKVTDMAKGDDRICFTGFVQGEALEELYANAYLYVLPSDLEGMPISLLEAMSYGNCCLVSDIAECTEVVEDKAHSFKKGNVDDLEKQLSFLLKDTNMVKAYKQEASFFICNKYNWDTVVEQTLQLYQKEE